MERRTNKKKLSRNLLDMKHPVLKLEVSYVAKLS